MNYQHSSDHSQFCCTNGIIETESWNIWGILVWKWSLFQWHFQEQSPIDLSHSWIDELYNIDVTHHPNNANISKVAFTLPKNYLWRYIIGESTVDLTCEKRTRLQMPSWFRTFLDGKRQNMELESEDTIAMFRVAWQTVETESDWMVATDIFADTCDAWVSTISN